MSKPDWENFAKAVLADWPTGDLEGSVLFDLALQYGMIQEVPGGYNSDHHIDADGICPEEGDPWYEYTFRGEAGPGLYSIHALTEQLEAARADAKEAEAYAEELQGDLTELCSQLIATEDKLATCEKYRDAYDKMGRIGTEAYRELEAKLAKAMTHVMDYSNDPHLVQFARTTLAEIEGSNAP
jgi:hypothetical protein